MKLMITTLVTGFILSQAAIACPMADAAAKAGKGGGGPSVVYPLDKNGNPIVPPGDTGGREGKGAGPPGGIAVTDANQH